jgi:hypothetical protein
VTNLRVILYGVGGRGLFGRTRLVQEVHIDRIIGVESFIGWGLNFLMLFLGGVFLVGGVLPYTNLVPLLSRLATPRLTIVWYGLIFLGVALIIMCFRQLFYVIVKPMAVSLDMAVSARRGFGWKDHRSLVFGQKPGRDAAALVRDLGAVILDAQNGEGTPEPPSFTDPGPSDGSDSDSGIPGFETGARPGGLPPHFGYEVSRSGEED